MALAALVAGCSASRGDDKGEGSNSASPAEAQSGDDTPDSAGTGQTAAAGTSGQTAAAGTSGQTAAGSSGQTASAGSSGQIAAAGSSGQTASAGTSGQSASAGASGQSASAGASGQSADAGHDSSGGGGRDSGSSGDVGAACAPAVSPVVETDPDGPGYDCMKSGCHLPSAPVQGGLTITVSGTLYDAKGNPLPGATVYVTDSMGKDLVLTTDNNANFWSGYADGKVLPVGNYGTCLTYVMCYPPSQFEGACQCATYAATGALKATSVSMCPNATASCGGLGTGANNGDCHTCHGGTASPPAIHLP